MPEAARRWLILVHQLPSHPSNLRVRVWRRLQQVGAVVLRNSLYVLPASDEAREDFNWVREEVQASGGQVSVLEASAVDGYTDAELVRQFRTQRTADYEALAADIRKAGATAARSQGSMSVSGRNRLVLQLRERFSAIQTRDYFAAAGRPLVEQAFRDLEEAASRSQPTGSPAKKLRTKDFKGRVWVTRPRPGIDRIACAWLIRRFIASDARFRFVNTPDAGKSGDIPFDMSDVEFGHHGSRCTFETLMERFALRSPAVVAISRVVHDLDVKDVRYGMPECAAVARIVDGLRTSYGADAELLEQGVVVIEALYQSFAVDHKRGRSARARSTR
jgi:hypothetical protein